MMKKLASIASLAAGIVIAAGTAAPVFGSSSTASSAISGSERRSKVLDVIAMLESAFGMTDKTINEEFGDGSTGSTMPYSDGATTKLKDMVKTLRTMLDADRLREGTMGGRAVTCPVHGGTDSDRVIVNSATLDAMCGNGPAGEGTVSDPCKAANFIYLGASLANELIHVYENPPAGETGDPRGCDVERDSDCASKKFLEEILEALTDGDGNPHDSVSDVYLDGDYVSMLGLVLNDTGTTSAAEIAALVAKVKQRLESYCDRKDNLFGAAITGGVNWGPIYYGGWDGTPVAPRRKDEPGRQFTEVTTNGGNDAQQYQVPPTTQLTQARTFFDCFEHVMLVQTSVDPGGNMVVQMFRDNDGDFLPEPIPAAPDFFLPFFTDPFLAELDSMAIIPYLPPQLHPFNEAKGLMFHDVITGSLAGIPLGNDGLPVGPCFPIIQDPQLTAGNFNFFQGDVVVGDELRLIFSTEGASNQFGEAPAAFVAIDLLGAPPLFVTFPGMTVAEANDPVNPVGIRDMFVGMPDFILEGNPGEQLDLLSIGQGLLQPLGGGIAGPDGSTFPIPPAPALAGNDLMLVTGSGGGSVRQFQPRIGVSADCAASDEDGDGTDDRIDLTLNPPRLHLSLGVPGTSSPELFNHHYEMVLPFGDDIVIRPSDPFDRLFLDASETPEVPIQMTSLNLVSCQPIQVIVDGQTQEWDLNVGLGGDNDGLSIFKVTPSTDWTTRIHVDGTGCIDLLPIPADFFGPGSLPFEPRLFTVQDESGNGANDIRVIDFNNNPDLCYVNDGAGNFVLVPCDEIVGGCDGDVDGNGIVDVNDITYVIFRIGNAGAPGTVDGDADGNGIVDVNDIAYVIFRLGQCN